MPYRAGIIGAGGIAGLGILGMHDTDEIGKRKFDASHAGGYFATDDVELVAIADPDGDKRETFGDAWEIPASNCYEDHVSMLELEDLDIVSVCTPTLLHHEHVIDAAEIGNLDAIWCEKPIASSVADANEMVSTCERTDTELLINHSFRFTEKIVRLRELIQEDGILGDVHSVTTQFRMELLRNSTHVLDSLLYLLDASPERISGHVTGENEVVDALEASRTVTDSGGGGFVVLDTGTMAAIDCTIPRESSSMSYQFIGDRGKLYLNNDDGEWRYWRLEDGSHVETTLPGIEDGWEWERDYPRAFQNAAAHIVDVLEGRAENRSTGEEATRSLEIIVGFYLSHYTDSTVTAPFEEPLQDVEITSW